MHLDRLSDGEKIAGISAILLFVFMFLHWFGVNATETSNLLMEIRRVLPGKSAWEALDYIPIVLLITIIATLAVAALRLTKAVHRPPVPVNAPVAILGLVSVGLILFRIVEPPIFDSEATTTLEGNGPITDLPRSVGCSGDRLWWLSGNAGRRFLPGPIYACVGIETKGGCRDSQAPQELWHLYVGRPSAFARYAAARDGPGR